MAIEYPTPYSPTDAALKAFDNQTIDATGVHIVKHMTSGPDHHVQGNRRSRLEQQMLAPINQCRCVKVTANTVGVFPGFYRQAGTKKFFTGKGSQAISSTADDYYVYIDAENTLQVSTTEPTGDEYLLAKVTVSGGEIGDEAIEDLRGYTLAMTSIGPGQIADGAVDTDQLAADAVTGAKIADDAIGSEHIADGAVGAAAIAAGAVGTTELGADAVTGAKIADHAIGSEHIAADAVIAAAISPGAVVGAKLALYSVTGTKIAGDAIDTEHLAAGAVDAAALASALQDAIPNVNISVGSESGDAIDVSVQFRDAANNSLAERCCFRAWLSDSQGGGETATAPDGAVTWSTGTDLDEKTAKKAWRVVMTDASGAAVLAITESGEATWYLHVVFDGKVYISGAITFAV